MFWSKCEKKKITLLLYFFCKQSKYEIIIEKFWFTKFDFIMLVQGLQCPSAHWNRHLRPFQTTLSDSPPPYESRTVLLPSKILYHFDQFMKFITKNSSMDQNGLKRLRNGSDNGLSGSRARGRVSPYGAQPNCPWNHKSLIVLRLFHHNSEKTWLLRFWSKFKEL